MSVGISERPETRYSNLGGIDLIIQVWGGGRKEEQEEEGGRRRRKEEEGGGRRREKGGGGRRRGYQRETRDEFRWYRSYHQGMGRREEGGRRRKEEEGGEPEIRYATVGGIDHIFKVQGGEGREEKGEEGGGEKRGTYDRQ
jgi:hypothetical protein